MTCKNANNGMISWRLPVTEKPLEKETPVSKNKNKAPGTAASRWRKAEEAFTSAA